MRFAKKLACCLFFLLAACAGNKTNVPQQADYVEVPNPAITMDPNATPTIWVPRSYVESGVPRGTQLVKKGYEQIKGTPQAAPPAQAPVMAAQQGVSLPVVPPVLLKNRVAVLEAGDNALLLPFMDKMRDAAFGVLLDPSQAVFLAKYSSVASPAERSTFAARLQQENGATVTIFVSAPDTVAPGKPLQAEIYDGMGAALVRTVTSVIPSFAPSDPAAKEAALGKALADLTDKVKEVATLLPWYAKVAAVEGDRAYINAGKEAGIKLGQTLKVFHGGKVIPGLGFAPGEKIATLEVGGYVGTNGAYGVIKEGKGVQANDLVSIQ